ncbi:MAG: class I SAM-dependent methyltransferase [Bacteroidetes bacterium]|nr:class I SAM-dependent methyltransferase [Bacteroidota bacterium]
MSNFKTYNGKKVVSRYLIDNELQKPEQKIIKILGDQLSDIKMLVIGVGGGRTSFHFAEHVKEYVGIDYAENKIKGCQRKFDFQKSTITFQVMDVRNMTSLNSNYFDFILFSFNGLDYISHQDRILALNEIKRVGKSSAKFLFSSHNIYSIPSLYKLSFSANPCKLLNRIRKLLTVVFINGSLEKYKKTPYAVINDGAHSFKLKTYYISPKEQLNQLKSVGFHSIETYSIMNGEEISLEDINNIEDPWIYYLCKIM